MYKISGAPGIRVTAGVEPFSNRGKFTVFDRRTYFIRCEDVVGHRTTDCYEKFARSKMDPSLFVGLQHSFDSARAQGAAEGALGNTGNAQGPGNRPNRLMRPRPSCFLVCYTPLAAFLGSAAEIELRCILRAETRC